MTTGVPVAVHEFLVAPAAILLAFRHARAALGARRAAGELLTLAVYGFALERLSMSVFGSHRYGAGWVLAPLGVPIAVALVWAAVISSALALAARRGLRPAWARALAAALFAVTLDLTIEPVAVRRGLWEWTPPGPWLGVPIGNFVGWVVIVAGYGIGAERWARGGRFGVEAARRLVLAGGALTALVAVGTVWTGLGMETVLGRRGGWLAWGLVLVTTAALGLRRAPAFEGETLAGRLAATSGMAPGLVFLAVATAFAAEAALLADAVIGLVALGTALALLPLLRPSGTASSG
ncbi:MAG TPA: carotenoid biosynthesis protein [Vicinamibacteria bacterium]|nr:carotenoid biosynthesis protein [Vicinamibacteria bacterium]